MYIKFSKNENFKSSLRLTGPHHKEPVFKIETQNYEKIRQIAQMAKSHMISSIIRTLTVKVP